MLLMEAFTLLNDERTVCTTLRWALSSCSLAPTEVVLRLFDLRGHRAALIQWQREVQADLVLPGIVILVLLRIIMGF